MNTSDKIQLLGVLTELALKEAELIWVRYTTMLYASTGLVGILAFSIEKGFNFVTLCTSLIGLALAIVWFQMIKLSGFYYQRWQKDADFLVSSDEELKNIVRGRISPRIIAPQGWAASQYGMIVPIVFSVGWLLVLLDALGLANFF